MDFFWAQELLVANFMSISVRERVSSPALVTWTFFLLAPAYEIHVDSRADELSD